MPPGDDPKAGGRGLGAELLEAQSRYIELQGKYLTLEIEADRLRAKLDSLGPLADLMEYVPVAVQRQVARMARRWKEASDRLGDGSDEPDNRTAP